MFRRLLTVSGDMIEIEKSLREIKAEGIPSLVQVLYTGIELLPDLSERVAAITEKLPIRCFCRNQSPSRRVDIGMTFEDINALTPRQVFERLLDERDLSPEDREVVLPAFDAIVEEITRMDRP